MTKRKMVGRQAIGILTVYDDEWPIGSIEVTEDHRFEAFGGDKDYRSLGVFDDLKAAAAAVPKMKTPAAA